MAPTPTPAPPMPMQAMPAPMYFAAIGSMTNSFASSCLVSMTRMDGIVEIDAGEDGKHVGLQEGDEQFECRQCNDHRQRQRCAGHADNSRASKQRDEACEYLQRDVTSQHVGKKTHAVRDRAREERQHFNEYDERQDVDRYALGHEQVEEVKPVLPESIDEDRQEDRHRQCCSNYDVRGDGEGVRDKPNDVHRQDEREQREHEGEETHPLGAGRTFYGVGDEFVSQLGGRLHAARHKASLGGAAQKECGDDHNCGDHVGRGVGEGDLRIANFDDRKQINDLELMNWIDSHELYSCLSRTTPAARITLSTPAAKPSNKKTMSPHGEIPSHRSSSQPISAPTSTPATSSVDSRKPRAIAEGSPV